MRYGDAKSLAQREEIRHTGLVVDSSGGGAGDRKHGLIPPLFFVSFGDAEGAVEEFVGRLVLCVFAPRLSVNRGCVTPRFDTDAYFYVSPEGA